MGTVCGCAGDGRGRLGRMTVYLLHYDFPIGDLSNPRGQAQHYVGSTDNLKQRLEAHRKGNGARLPEVFAEQGIEFVLARTWAGGKKKERLVKGYKKNSLLCPVCSGKRSNRYLSVGTEYLYEEHSLSCDRL
jgi:putative endonuclease